MAAAPRSSSSPEEIQTLLHHPARPQQTYRLPNNRLPRTRHKPREDERVGQREGAVGGAVFGCIVGDAGKGAAIGAVGGTMRGGRRQRQANEQSQQQSAPSAGAQVQRQYSQAKAAYSQIKKEES